MTNNISDQFLIEEFYRLRDSIWIVVVVLHATTQT